MTLTLTEDLFSNDEYSVNYADKRATFIIVDEEFAGVNHLGRINRINCLVRTFDQNGAVASSSFHPTVIGLADDLVGVRSAYPELRGTLMTHENMDKCEVILYE
jgi:hypothetical protein